MPNREMMNNGRRSEMKWTKMMKNCQNRTHSSRSHVSRSHSSVTQFDQFATISPFAVLVSVLCLSPSAIQFTQFSTSALPAILRQGRHASPPRIPARRCQVSTPAVDTEPAERSLPPRTALGGVSSNTACGGRCWPPRALHTGRN